MFKYIMAVAALKFFSATPQTKWVYRKIGNSLGQKIRIHDGLPKPYLERVGWILEKCKMYDLLTSEDKLLEIGTGWVHWEATIIRLFYDIDITLFDIWDNRQFAAYQQYFRQLASVISSEIPMNTAQRERVDKMLGIITHGSSFEEIYKQLGFHYVVDPSGTLRQFADNSISLIISYNVLEHVNRVILPLLTRDFYRVLKPGGYSIHRIDPGDHLSYYDKHVSIKNYLQYSDHIWDRYFENDVQYFNRVQRPEWLHLFQQAGFTTIEEIPTLSDIGSIKVANNYKSLTLQDLQCIALNVVHQKPIKLCHDNDRSENHTHTGDHAEEGFASCESGRSV